jgi:DNA-binding transcriptional LysR family regulator
MQIPARLTAADNRFLIVDRLSVMETFIRVVETGSFSAAAKHLNVGQPAVSKSVAQLEARLGVILLIRSTRRLVPTEAGRDFCERARRAIEQADEADHAARDAVRASRDACASAPPLRSRACTSCHGCRCS